MYTHCPVARTFSLRDVLTSICSVHVAHLRLAFSTLMFHPPSLLFPHGHFDTTFPSAPSSSCSTRPPKARVKRTSARAPWSLATWPIPRTPHNTATNGHHTAKFQSECLRNDFPMSKSSGLPDNECAHEHKSTSRLQPMGSYVFPKALLPCDAEDVTLYSVTALGYIPQMIDEFSPKKFQDILDRPLRRSSR